MFDERRLCEEVTRLVSATVDIIQARMIRSEH